MARSAVLNVRAGQHACFDRLVIDMSRGAKPGYRVEYVGRIIQDPSGKVIHVRGGAKLRITMLSPVSSGFPANGHELAKRVPGAATPRPRPRAVSRTRSRAGRCRLAITRSARSPAPPPAVTLLPLCRPNTRLGR
jgi:hypothetical protein